MKDRATFQNTQKQCLQGRPPDDPTAQEDGAGGGAEDAYLGGEFRQAGLTRSWTEPTFCVEADVQWVCSGVDPEVGERDNQRDIPESNLAPRCLGQGPMTGRQAQNFPIH